MAITGFRLPAGLAAQGYALRMEREDDLPFLRRLYASTREAEFAHLTDWSAEARRAFCDQQFMAQRLHYQSQIPGCVRLLILSREERVGRLYVEERVTQIHVVDIALMPDHRGRGIGGAILAELARVAETRDKGLGIFVEKYNPALRLYRRLGFAPLRETEIYWEMERPIGLAAANVS